MTHELILHHYDFSSYSEKVRLVLFPRFGYSVRPALV